MLEAPQFREYMGDGLDTDKGVMTERRGDWKVFYFYENFVPQLENQKRCPKTTAVLKQLGNRPLLGMVRPPRRTHRALGTHVSRC